MHELPQRQRSIDLYGSANSITEARRFLEEKKYSINHEYIYDEHLIHELKKHQMWQIGDDSKRLWQASPLVRYFQQHYRDYISHEKPQGLDIACGSGRDMTYLASHGWAMCGVDYQAEALSRSASLASIESVETQCLQIDIEKDICAFEQLMLGKYPAGFDLINVSRYLHRPLLPVISRLLKPGGILLYQTFMQGCETISSPKNPNYLLKVDELSQCYRDFTLLEDQVLTLDDGRPVSFFIAQKN